MTHHDISGDEVHDLRLDGNRQVEVGADGDLRITHGIETVEQSVAIEAGQVLRPLIGGPLTGETYEDVQEELRDILSRDPQIENVQRVEITEVNRSTGNVTVEVFTSYNNSFELGVTVQ